MRKQARRHEPRQRRTIEDEIAHLRDLDLKGLRRWQNEFGRLAPEHLTRHLLFRIIAYKLQADRFGDLDAETLKVLQQAAGLEGRPPAISRALAVNFQEVVHSAPAVNADVARQAVIRGGTEWTLTRMRL
jgi:hypothetical protein